VISVVNLDYFKMSAVMRFVFAGTSITLTTLAAYASNPDSLPQ
jgi:hypothetical protein